MATVTLTMSRPAVSSPLAQSSQSNVTATQRIVPKRTPSFPCSRALRPFPTISHMVQPAKSGKQASNQRPVKLIEPPKNFKATFVLDLTQAEFSRQE